MSKDLYQGIHEYNSYEGDLNLGCDAVVVGSGPTGAVVAYNLVEAGYDVILLEAGPVKRPHEFSLDGAKTLAETAFEGGIRALMGSAAIPTIQARVLGGGSLINSAMCLRTPDFCFDDWQESFGVKTIDGNALAPHYDRIEKYLGIQPTEESALKARNLLFKKGCDELGWHSEPTPRNVVGCDGCAECFSGCPTRAKKSTDITYVPDGIKKGLRVYTSVEVRKILHSNGVTQGVEGVVAHPHPARKGKNWSVRVNAKIVVLGAGCLATPVLLQKSNAPDPYKLIGKNLQAHPGAAMLGVFEEEVNPWEGATQGYQSKEFLEQGFKMEVLWSPPAVLAVRLPGFGERFGHNLAAYKHGAPWDAIFSLKHSKGSVKASRGKSMNPVAKYSVDKADMPLVRDGMSRILEMFFAAGAKSVLPGIWGMPEEVSDPKTIQDLRAMSLKASDLVLASTHLFSTTRLGPDPAHAVVDESGEMHYLKNCYICDTGVMPRSPAVNPMLTGMALADFFSAAMIDRLA